MNYPMILLALAGMFLLSEADEDPWRSRSVKMTEKWSFLAFSSTVRLDRTDTCDAIIYNQKWTLISQSCTARNATMFYYGGGNKWCDDGSIAFPYESNVQIRKLKRSVSAPQNDWSFPHWVVKLVEVLPIAYNENVQPATLATRVPIEGEKLDSTGWVETPTVSESNCYERYKVTVSKVNDALCPRPMEDHSANETLICFDPPRSRKTYSKFMNDGAPLVKEGTVYGLMIYSGKYFWDTSTENIDPQPPIAMPVAPYIPWINYVTSEHWYPHLDELLATHSICF